MARDKLTQAWLDSSQPKFVAKHNGSSWGVYFVGPRGGQRCLVTYYEKGDALKLSALLNSQWDEGCMV